MNIMLFDVLRHAHLPSYLRYLIEYWNAHDFSDTCYIVVARAFGREHADVVRMTECAPRRNIHFVTLTKEEETEKRAVEEAYGSAEMTFAEVLRADAPPYGGYFDWELFCRYSREYSAARGFLMSLDLYLPWLATRVEAPVLFAGIFMGPTFHYPAFDDAQTTAQLESGRMMREKFVLARALRMRQLERLWFLDPHAVEAAHRFPDGDKAAFLPDPVRAAPVSRQEVEARRAELGIEAGRKIFLLFGELTERKGIRELFDALERLTGDAARRMCIVLAGRAAPMQEAELEKECAALRACLPLQIVERYAYIPHGEVAAYFQLADVVLAPYPKHNGMSGILLLAAAYQKPVLSSGYGSMGQMTREHKLGIAVDVRQPSQMAEALTRLTVEDAERVCDFEQMKILAEEHSPERFASGIFQTLGCL